MKTNRCPRCGSRNIESKRCNACLSRLRLRFGFYRKAVSS